MDTYTEIERFLDYLADAILIVDDKSNILFANSSCARLFSYDKSTLLTLKIDNLMATGIQSHNHSQKVAGFIRNQSRAKVMMARKIMPCLNAEGHEFNARISIANIEFKGKQCGIATIQDYSSVQSVINELASEACTDSLTGLFNKRHLENITSNHNTEINGSPVFGVAYLDLNGFKAINDTFGHDVGDELLIEIAGRLKKQMRTGDLSFRLGGDEFLLLFGINNPDNYEQKLTVVGSKVHEIIEKPIYIEKLNRELNVGVSIGIGIMPFDDRDLATLISKADKAMYLSKTSKKPYVLAAELDRSGISYVESRSPLPRG
ncbi:sensor domain-containing diguanylate cyclase [Vibrio sp. JC009]|uniref:sensor domain-containing diguanylate cyclase n=1 Tax=Vibrio sp. JC009 TaxID=2912314 RepID=UPI0023AFABF5|nr:sensor domain-containing diguanylate cyclase [Vibrio sp. JC009]WED20771.1 sensor domain-containing diguanylate cyclase [Vibrio sp. JC009]